MTLTRRRFLVLGAIAASSALARQVVRVPPVQASVQWPTGWGWTAGARSTCRANIQGLIDANRTGVHHRLTPGATYPIDRALDFNGCEDVVFDGGGTPRRYGHEGGATVQTNGDAHEPLGGGFANRWTYKWKPTRNIWFRGLTIEGSSTWFATPQAHDHGEQQHGIDAFGVKGLSVGHCIIQKMLGDCVCLGDSHNGWTSDGYPASAAVPTSDVLIHGSLLRWTARILVTLTHARGVTVESNKLDDPGMGYVVVEPDAPYQRNAGLVIARNDMTGHWGWEAKYHTAGIMMTVNRAGNYWYDGEFAVTDNVVSGTSARDASTPWIHAVWGPTTKTGPVDISNNVRTAGAHGGPVVVLDRFVVGGRVVSNRGFLTGGSFLVAEHSEPLAVWNNS